MDIYDHQTLKRGPPHVPQQSTTIISRNHEKYSVEAKLLIFLNGTYIAMQNTAFLEQAAFGARESGRTVSGPADMTLGSRAMVKEKKMVPKGLEKKLLKYMRRRHKLLEQYGPKDLKASRLLLTSGHEIGQEIPEMLVKLEGGRKRFLVPETVSELERQGYVELNAAGAFWLTEAGYRQATKWGWIQKSIMGVNQRPGLSIPLSLSAIVVSIISLLLRCYS